MKLLAVFALLVAGISAQSVPQNPPGPERNPVTDLVIAAIEDAIEGIRDLGLDPLHIKGESFAYSLPVPVILNAAAAVEDVLSTGLSDIIITHINYSILFFRLTFTLELPHIHFSVGQAAAEAVVFGNELSAYASGSVDIRRITVSGVANVGIIGGIGVRDLNIDFNLGAIDSNLQVNVLGRDLSNSLNGFLGESVPRTLSEFKREMDELLGIVMLDLIAGLI